jgi:hypothetical protein
MVLFVVLFSAFLLLPEYVIFPQLVIIQEQQESKQREAKKTPANEKSFFLCKLSDCQYIRIK